MVEASNSIRSPGLFAWSAKGPDAALALSVIAPMHNEAEGAAALIAEIAAALAHISHEIIIVDDSSSDDTAAVVKDLKDAHSQLRLIRHGRTAGQSRAIRTGVLAARASIIVMIDGDGQNDPADIPALYEKLKSEGAERLAMVAGERKNRKDSTPKRWASSWANGLRRRLLNDGAVDTGCGLKVFYQEAFLRLPYFDHMHRYLPALMKREGYGVAFLPVSHRPRVHGASKYTNFGRFLVAIRDMMGMIWLLSRSKSPESIRESDD